MSLKIKLNDFIKSRNGEIIDHNIIVSLCNQWGYRISNAERRLRENTMVGTKRNSKGAIIGYYWIGLKFGDLSVSGSPSHNPTNQGNKSHHGANLNEFGGSGGLVNPQIGGLSLVEAKKAIERAKQQEFLSRL